jgi:hypothetical protein
VIIPGFSAEASLHSEHGHYNGGRPSMYPDAAVQPAQSHGVGVQDPCLLGPHIRVTWQPFHDGRRGVVLVSGNNFAPRSSVRVRFDNCTSAFPELGSATTNACGEFTVVHTCTCAGPPIGVESRDFAGNSVTETLQPSC